MTRVVVSGLAENVTDAELRALFGKSGVHAEQEIIFGDRVCVSRTGQIYTRQTNRRRFCVRGECRARDGV